MEINTLLILQESEYFDADEEGNTFKIESPQDISNYVIAALDGRLKVCASLP